MKCTLSSLVLIIVPFLSGCHGSVKKEKENKNHVPPTAVTLHVGDEKYVGIDTKESVVAWKGANSFGSHTGYVTISKGELKIENGQLVGGTVEVDMTTIVDEKHASDNGVIDHLKDADFFDVKKFPVSIISISKVEPTNGEDIKVTGDLTIKGITQPVSFPAKMVVKDGIIEANGKLLIDRTNWGIRYKSGKFYDLLADKTISDDIEFTMKIVAKPSKESLAQASLLNREISKEILAGTIYQSSSPHHNVLHDFTYLMAIQDFCTATLSQMHTNGEANKEVIKQLEKELLNAKAALTSSKFTGLKIEAGLYEKFLKQMNERLRQLPLATINEC